jgi:hypothetical protein
MVYAANATSLRAASLVISPKRDAARSADVTHAGPGVAFTYQSVPDAFSNAGVAHFTIDMRNALGLFDQSWRSNIFMIFQPELLEPRIV